MAKKASNSEQKVRQIWRKSCKQYRQVLAAELQQLVEKEYAHVRRADLAGIGPSPAAHQPGTADGVVRRAQGPRADQPFAVGQGAGLRRDAHDAEGLR